MNISLIEELEARLGDLEAQRDELTRALQSDTITGENRENMEERLGDVNDEIDEINEKLEMEKAKPRKPEKKPPVERKPADVTEAEKTVLEEFRERAGLKLKVKVQRVDEFGKYTSIGIPQKPGEKIPRGAIIVDPAIDDLVDVEALIGRTYGSGTYRIMFSAPKSSKVRPIVYDFSISDPEADRRIQEETGEYEEKEPSPIPTEEIPSAKKEKEGLMTLLQQTMDDNKKQYAENINRLENMMTKILEKKEVEGKTAEKSELVGTIGAINKLLADMKPAPAAQREAPSPIQDLKGLAEIIAMLKPKESMVDAIKLGISIASTGTIPPELGIEEKPKGRFDQFLDKLESATADRVSEIAVRTASDFVGLETGEKPPLPAGKEEAEEEEMDKGEVSKRDLIEQYLQAQLLGLLEMVKSKQSVNMIIRQIFAQTPPIYFQYYRPDRFETVYEYILKVDADMKKHKSTLKQIYDGIGAVIAKRKAIKRKRAAKKKGKPAEPPPTRKEETKAKKGEKKEEKEAKEGEKKQKK